MSILICPQIECVQNVSLYQQYKAKAKELEKHNAKDVKNEKRLYHGTDSQTVTRVAQNGFNRNYCGKNGNVFYEKEKRVRVFFGVCAD